MDSWRFSHHRRLIALSTLLVAVLVAAVIITVHTMRQRQELSANYSSALGLAANSSTLRVAASELFTWQIAGTLGMLEGRPDATDAADPARQQYGDAIRGIDAVLGRLATGPLDTAERAQLDQARAALADLRRRDQAIRTDYASGDEARMRAAARTATTTGIDQFQVVSDCPTRQPSTPSRRSPTAGAGTPGWATPCDADGPTAPRSPWSSSTSTTSSGSTTPTAIRPATASCKPWPGCARTWCAAATSSPVSAARSSACC